MCGPPPAKKQKVSGEVKGTAETRICSSCKESKDRSAYSRRQWNRPGRRCGNCLGNETMSEPPPDKKEKVSGEVKGTAETRICASCKESKDRSAYGSRRQWSRPGRRCGNCIKNNIQVIKIKCPSCNRMKIPTDFKDTDDEGKGTKKCNSCIQAELDRIKEEAKKRKRDEEFKREFGAQIKMPTFEVPMASGPRDFSFSENEMTLESLLEVGKYELIYYNSYDGNQEELCHSRMTRGYIEFTEGHDDGELKGVLSVDKSVRKDMIAHHVDIEIKVTKETSSKNNQLDFHITNDESLRYSFQELAYDGGVKGCIMKLGKQLAIQYMPEESVANDISLKYAKSIPKFESVNEAEKILQKYHEIGDKYLWLENHKSVPSEVSQLIHKFSSLKPQPVLIFEENDIYIDIDWEVCYHGGSYWTRFVARPMK